MQETDKHSVSKSCVITDLASISYADLADADVGANAIQECLVISFADLVHATTNSAATKQACSTTNCKVASSKAHGNMYDKTCTNTAALPIFKGSGVAAMDSAARRTAFCDRDGAL
jgi:hypothetical protein